MKVVQYLVSNDEEMVALGRSIADELDPFVNVIFFEGDLGSGKTTLIKGMISQKAGIAKEMITSPTFNIVHMFGSIAHFDLYRLKTSDEFYARGLEEYLHTSSLCLIEWPEKALDALPKKPLKITIQILPSFIREVSLSW